MGLSRGLVSVQGVGPCPGDLCLGVSVQEGFLSRGVFCQEISVQGGLYPGGLCPGGSLSREVFVQGVSVGGSLCRGVLCPEGVFVQGVSVGGSFPRGSLLWVSVQGGLCPGRVLCPGGFSVQGISVQGVLCPEGVSVQEGSVSRGVFVQGVSVWGPLSRGGLCQGDHPPAYVNVRKVHILLECILLRIFFRALMWSVYTLEYYPSTP